MIKNNTSGIRGGLATHALEALASPFSLFLAHSFSKITTNLGIGANSIKITFDGPCYYRLIQKDTTKKHFRGMLATFGINTTLISVLSMGRNYSFKWLIINLYDGLKNISEFRYEIATI